MPRRDQLTYDLGDSSSRGPVPWLPLVVLVAVLGLVTLLVAGVVRSGGDPEAAPAAPGSTSIATATAAPSTPGPGVSTPPTGSDADEAPAAPEGSERAAVAFVDAWLDRDPKTRPAALAAVSAPALAEGLMLTDPANIPKATRRGAPELVDASTYSSQFTQALSTGLTIEVYLVADPAARYQWLATSVEQA
ncbi:hypothetical protein SAMN04488543_0088 [Friedmanniella luteola]|uniref:Uncharacterized protein n=1 Tax=Friedmanniella luteola TaxID=546871 RepID=A0A1H1L4Z5_9ACTN|nr:hypothetical protein [Friedmanniella luteola]SDR69654.1 hypothetical protein SAMN04488543_0088 [Friedmanniella luteola]